MRNVSIRCSFFYNFRLFEPLFRQMESVRKEHWVWMAQITIIDRGNIDLLTCDSRRWPGGGGIGGCKTPVSPVSVLLFCCILMSTITRILTKKLRAKTRFCRFTRFAIRPPSNVVMKYNNFRFR